MRKTSSFRLSPEIKNQIARYGGGTFIEGCVILCLLAKIPSIAQKVALEHEMLGFPPLEGIELSGSIAISYVSSDRLLQTKSPDEPFSLDRLISDLADIPDDCPLETRQAITSLLARFGEKEPLNI